MEVIKPPTEIERRHQRPSLFLAGSIEMGAAEDWQSRLITELRPVEGTIFNPRRDDWDSSWEQSINNRHFREQVEWELDALEAATLIAMYFAPGTKSPISLLELGLFAITPPGHNRLVVYSGSGAKGTWTSFVAVTEWPRNGIGTRG